MTPRKAALRVAHSRACANANQTSLDSLRGCTCTPAYYTFHRDRSGRTVKGPRVSNRREATKALNKIQVAIDEGRVGIDRPAETTFSEWAETYLEIVARRRKASTVDAYRTTLNAYALPAFGPVPLAAIGNPDLRRLEEAVRDNGGTDATLAKHLRHVGAIMQAAADDGLIQANPVPRFKKHLRLRVVGGVPPYTDVELARLWASMEALGAEPAYVAFCKCAVATGARAGELAGLNLDDVDLAAGTLRIERHYDRATGALTLPKDGEPRTVHLIPPARVLLEQWLARHGGRPGGEPLFPAPHGGRMNAQYLAKLVTAAMASARPPIPKPGETGRPRKPLHSLRASFDRLCLERGLAPQFVQAELGHSSAELTLQTYGEWSESAKALEAARVELLGFPV